METLYSQHEIHDLKQELIPEVVNAVNLMLAMITMKCMLCEEKIPLPRLIRKGGKKSVKFCYAPFTNMVSRLLKSEEN